MRCKTKNGTYINIAAKRLIIFHAIPAGPDRNPADQ